MRVTQKPSFLRSSASLLRARLSFSTLAVSLSLAALLGSPVAEAQSATPLLATPTVRITAPVTNDALVTLKGNVHPMAQARYDQGAASTSLATGKMELLLRRSPSQQEALREYLGALQNPHSASYRKWLTPTSYGASFGISAQDLQTVETWLESEGFKIESVPASGNMIQFSGTFGQVGQAFHTSIHSYVIKGVQHYSNASDPEIPAALAPVIQAISPLNDFHSKPMHVLGGHVNAEKAGTGLKVVSPATGSQTPAHGSPLLTLPDSNNQPFLLLTPADVATIYDAPNTLNRNYSGSTEPEQVGTGVNIGLVGDTDLPKADYQNYRQFFLNESAPAAPNVVIDGVDPGTNGDAVEALIDTEFAAGLAPGASIYYYESNDDLLQDGIYDASLRAVEDNNVAVLSVSYGNCELNEGPDGNQAFSELWQEAAAQGITALVSAGDNGSAACDSDEEAAATQGLAVNGLASTPYNIAVGGTDFDLLTLADNFSTYVSDNGSSSGTSPYTLGYGSALGYIPENPWDDSISNNPPGAYTSDIATQYSQGAGEPTTTIIAAGSGGVSSAAVCSGPVDDNGNCEGLLGGYAKPPFQSAVSGTARSLPDISLFSSPGDQHQAGWAYCSDGSVDPSITGTDCVVSATGAFTVGDIGGTSTASPAYAGILAQVVQSLGSGQRLGLANNVIYDLAQKSYGTIFHDVTVGNNSVPCTGGAAADCGTNNFITGYNAGTGYDLATGLGSVDIAQLITGWDSDLASFTATTTALTANGGTAAISIVHGTAVTLATTIAPSTATGTVSVVGPTSAAGAAVNVDIPLTSGAGSQSIDYLPGGNYSIHAYYPGDATDAPSTSASIPVTVTPEASAINFSYQIEDVNSGNAINGNPVPFGAYGFAYVEPENATGTDNHGPATGSVTLLNSGTISSTQALNSQGVAAFPLYNLAPATYAFGARYGGDASYGASSTTANQTLVISKGATKLAISASSTSIPASGSTTITVELGTDSASATYPTGAITLTANGTTFAGGTPTPGTTMTGADAIFETFTVSGASLASGSNTLTASYGGDTNYNAAGSISVTVNNSGGSSTGAGFNLAGPANGVTVGTPGTAATGTVTVTPTNGFTGTVALTCQVAISIGGAAPTCSVPASVAVTAGTAATATLTINSSGTSAALHAPRNGGPEGSPLHRLLEDGGGVALASVLLLAIPARRRSWRAMLSVRSILMVLLAFGALGILGMMGCGGTSTNSGTSAGTYTVTVTGTSGGVTANTTVAVTIE